MKKSFVFILACTTMLCCRPPQSNEAVAVESQTVVSNPVTLSEPAIIQTDFTEVAAATIDAVVHIKCTISKLTPYYQSFFGMIIDRGMQRQEYEAFGSGVIISDDGYIVTNNHVVQDAASITVTLNDKRKLPATLIGLDPASDLAVIKINASGLRHLSFGNSDNVRIGEPVLAIGNPFNLTSTVTAGIISAKARDIHLINNPSSSESPIESFLQTDAAVNSGNSGGALVNARAELIGIIAAIASGNGYYTGYSFAIPANIAKKVSSDLRNYGAVQRGYLGVVVVEMTSELAAHNALDSIKGVYIDRVLPKCAAENAGLREGDVILKVNGVVINSYNQMMEEVALFNPGDKVKVVYIRKGQEHEATLTLLNSHGNTEIVRGKK